VSDATVNGTTKPKRVRVRGKTWEAAVKALRSGSDELGQATRAYTDKDLSVSLARAASYLDRLHPPTRRRK
jgi:hypothetical protein